jgi:hypothetical protein
MSRPVLEPNKTCSIGYGGNFPKGKATGDWGWPFATCSGLRISQSVSWRIKIMSRSVCYLQQFWKLVGVIIEFYSIYLCCVHPGFATRHARPLPVWSLPPSKPVPLVLNLSVRRTIAVKFLVVLCYYWRMAPRANRFIFFKTYRNLNRGKLRFKMLYIKLLSVR